MPEVNPKLGSKKLKRPQKQEAEHGWNIGDSVTVDDEEATVKITNAPGDTVGVMKDGELKMIDKDDVARVDEAGVLGMTAMPGLKRIQELAGLSPADNPMPAPPAPAPAAPVVDVASKPVVPPAPPMTPPPVPAGPAPVVVDEPPMDMGMDDMGMGGPMDAPADMGMSPMGAPDMADAMGAVDSLNDADSLDRAIKEIEDMIPNVRISEYKSLVTRLKALVSMAEQAGKSALTEARMKEGLNFGMSNDFKAKSKPKGFDGKFAEINKPTDLRGRMAAVTNRSRDGLEKSPAAKRISAALGEEEVEEGMDTAPRAPKPTDNRRRVQHTPDADAWLHGDEDEEHDFVKYRRSHHELEEDEIEEAPQPMASSTPRKARRLRSMPDFDDANDWLSGEDEEVHHRAPRPRELDEDKFKAKDKEERKTLMDYIKEVDETGVPGQDDPETLGSDRNSAIQAMQARMGDNTSSTDASKAFDKLRGQGKIKQNGSKFTMDPTGDEGLNKSLQEGMEKTPTAELKKMVKALSMHSWNNTAEEKQRLADAKAELARRAKK